MTDDSIKRRSVLEGVAFGASSTPELPLLLAERRVEKRPRSGGNGRAPSYLWRAVPGD